MRCGMSAHFELALGCDLACGSPGLQVVSATVVSGPSEPMVMARDTGEIELN